MEEVIEWAVNFDNGAETPQDVIRASDRPEHEGVRPDVLVSLATSSDEVVPSTYAALQRAVTPPAPCTMSACTW